MAGEERRKTRTEGKVYTVRRTVGGELLMAGIRYDRGQVLKPETVARLNGIPATDIDTRLGQMLRQGYLEEHDDKGPRLPECGRCGGRFVTERARDAHGDKRHPARRRRKTEDLEAAPAGGRATDPRGAYGEGTHAAEDVTGDDQERREDREAPLRMDQTLASLRS